MPRAPETKVLFPVRVRPAIAAKIRKMVIDGNWASSGPMLESMITAIINDEEAANG